MAVTIGRLFVEIGGDTKQLNEALKQAIDSANSAGVEITRAGKSFINSFKSALNPTKALTDQVELLQKAGYDNAQIWAVMGDKIISGMKVAETNGQAVSDTIKNLAGENAKAGTSFDDLGSKLKAFASDPLGAAKTEITGFMEKLGPTGIALTAIGAAIGAVSVGVFEMIRNLSDAQEHLANLSAITGISTQNLEAYGQFAKEAGLEGLDLGRTLSMVNKQLGAEGDNKFKQALEELGVSVRDASGRSRDAVSILDDLRTALLSIADPTERAQAANQVLGGRLRELIPLILNSKISISEVAGEMERFGITTDELSRAHLEQFDAALDKTGRAWEGLKHQVKLAVSEWILTTPAISAIIAKLSEGTPVTKEMTDAILKNKLATDLKYQADLAAQNAAVNNRAIYDAMVAQKKKDEEASKRVAEEVRKLQEHYDTTTGSIASAVEILEKWAKTSGEAQEAARALGADVEKAGASLEKTSEDLFFSTTAAMAQADKERSKSLTDSLDINLKDYKRFQDETLGITGKVRSVWKDMTEGFTQDFSRSMADAIVDGRNFGEAIGNTFKNLAKNILSYLIDTLFNPLKKFIAEAISGLLNMVSGGMFGGAGAGGMFGNLFGGGGGGGGFGAGSSLFSSLSDLLGGPMGVMTMTGGLALGIKGFFDKGGKGWAEALAGGFLAAGLPGLAAAAVAKGVQALVKAFQGKSAEEAGAMEVTRDLGGISLPEEQFKGFWQTAGFKDEEVWPIRKDIIVSPKFLTEVGLPLALLQNKMEPFLKALEKVTVDTKIAAEGFINFRPAMEDFIKTGSAQALNDLYQKYFAKSEALMAVMPDLSALLASSAIAAATTPETPVVTPPSGSTTVTPPSTDIIGVGASKGRLIGAGGSGIPPTIIVNNYGPVIGSDMDAIIASSIKRTSQRGGLSFVTGRS